MLSLITNENNLRNHWKLYCFFLWVKSRLSVGKGEEFKVLRCYSWRLEDEWKTDNSSMVDLHATSRVNFNATREAAKRPSEECIY